MENQSAATAALLAWRFVHQVQAMMDRTRDGSDLSIDTTRLLSQDGVYAAAKRLLNAQQEFRLAGKPTKVDLGYHYTREVHLHSIQTHGLLTKMERNSNEISNVHNNGSSYGDGIYTASSPCAYHGKFGAVGLVVARLRGHNTDGCRGTQGHGDSWTAVRNHVHEITVLAMSNQCIPILQFRDCQVVPCDFAHAGNRLLCNYQAELQTIIDEIFNTPYEDQCSTSLVDTKQFNGNTVTKIPQIVVYHHHEKSSRDKFRCTPEAIEYLAPLTLLVASCGSLLSAYSSSHEPWRCPHCCQPPRCTSLLFELKMCKHTFHYECLEQALGDNHKCPSCRKVIGAPQGRMPSGKMVIRHTDDSCTGYDDAGTICIEYIIPRHLQKGYHPHPGEAHGSFRCRSYLPETLDGLNLLKRLKYAFTHGLTLTVGISQNVAWASIPHKMSMSGGLHEQGFPDPYYIAYCNEELDDLSCPNAEEL